MQRKTKASGVEAITTMLREHSPVSPTEAGFYNTNQSIIIRGLPESTSDVASERIQNDLQQFTEMMSTIFENSQEIRVLKAYRMGEAYCNKTGEQTQVLG